MILTYITLMEFLGVTIWSKKLVIMEIVGLFILLNVFMLILVGTDDESKSNMMGQIILHSYKKGKFYINTLGTTAILASVCGLLYYGTLYFAVHFPLLTLAEFFLIMIVFSLANTEISLICSVLFPSLMTGTCITITACMLELIIASALIALHLQNILFIFALLTFIVTSFLLHHFVHKKFRLN
jgi:hypothetical protein